MQLIRKIILLEKQPVEIFRWAAEQTGLLEIFDAVPEYRLRLAGSTLQRARTAPSFRQVNRRCLSKTIKSQIAVYCNYGLRHPPADSVHFATAAELITHEEFDYACPQQTGQIHRIPGN